MLQFAGLAPVLGLAVFIVGMVVQYLLIDDEAGPKFPLWLRLLSVLSWVIVSLGLTVVMKYVQNSGQPITIHTALLFCIVAFLLSWGMHRGLLWVGSYYHANRGGRMFREVMAQKKEGRAFDGQRRWQQ